MFRAAAIPLRGLRRSRISGKVPAMASTICLVPSVDPSSITMISRSTLSRSRSSDRIAASMKRPALRAGMMTLTGNSFLTRKERSDRIGDLRRVLRKSHAKGREPADEIGKKAKSFARVARKLENARWCQGKRCSTGSFGL